MSVDPRTPRTGIGLDRHRLKEGRPCILGGVKVPCDRGPAGHSDGDVLLHALTDALLGAAGLDDLGTLFPDDDPRWAGADSRRFLDVARERLAAAGWRAASVDAVLVADTPRIAPHRAAIRANLAAALDLPVDRVNVKGKSTEGAGGDWIDATVVVLLIAR